MVKLVRVADPIAWWRRIRRWWLRRTLVAIGKGEEQLQGLQAFAVDIAAFQAIELPPRDIDGDLCIKVFRNHRGVLQAIWQHPMQPSTTHLSIRKKPVMGYGKAAGGITVCKRVRDSPGYAETLTISDGRLWS